jgi:hypothetical protein
MVKVLVATKVRGFLEDLFHSSLDNISFHWNKNEVYEIDSKKKLILSKLVKSGLASHLGIVQVVEVDDDGFDVVFSYNRFLKTNKDYIICLENPTALFHYALGRNKTFLGKKKINGCLNDGHLKGIVCISDACYSTLPNFYDLPGNDHGNKNLSACPFESFDYNRFHQKEKPTRKNQLFVHFFQLHPEGRERHPCLF